MQIWKSFTQEKGGSGHLTVQNLLTDLPPSKRDKWCLVIVGNREFLTTFQTLYEGPFSIPNRSLGDVSNHGGLKCVFFDRDGDCFAYVLNFLRCGDLCSPNDIHLLRQLWHEAYFFELPKLKRIIKERLQTLSDPDPVSVHSALNVCPSPTENWLVAEAPIESECATQSEEIIFGTAGSGQSSPVVACRQDVTEKTPDFGNGVKAEVGQKSYTDDMDAIYYMTQNSPMTSQYTEAVSSQDAVPTQSTQNYESPNWSDHFFQTNDLQTLASTLENGSRDYAKNRWSLINDEPEPVLPCDKSFRLGPAVLSTEEDF